MTKTNEERIEEFTDKFCFSIVKPIHLDDHVDAEEALDWLRTLLTEKDKEREEAVAKYQELLMAVEFKHEGETRHQTALRYIQQTELPHLIGVTAYQSELDQPTV